MKSKINVSKLDNYRKEHNLSLTAFCKKCAISIQTYNKMISNDLNYRTTALFKVARTVRIQIKDLFVDE